MVADQRGKTRYGLPRRKPRGIGVVVDAQLVVFGRIDAIEPVGGIADLGFRDPSGTGGALGEPGVAENARTTADIVRKQRSIFGMDMDLHFKRQHPDDWMLARMASILFVKQRIQIDIDLAWRSHVQHVESVGPEAILHQPDLFDADHFLHRVRNDEAGRRRPDVPDMA